MNEARAFEAAFARALVAADPNARPPGLDALALSRFAVYRNNVHLALQDALAQAYPAVARLVGDAFFALLARAYHAAQPARPASLALHGAGFAEVIESVAAADAVPYLGGVARLERAWLESFHAEDAAPLDPRHLSGDDAALDALRFRAHPALRLVLSDFPIVSLWQANAPGAADAPPPDIVLRAEAALVVRPRLAVQVLMLDEPEARLTGALLLGASVAEARSAAGGDSGFDAGRAVRALAAAGAFRSIEPNKETSP